MSSAPTKPVLHDPADNPVAPYLRRIPLSLRMTVYTIAFLGVVLAALPFAFSYLDVWVPAVHVEIGSLRAAGWIWFGVSLVLYLLCAAVLTIRGQGPFVEMDPPKNLVVEGPYRIVRNPVVVCLLSSMFGLAIAFSSTGILLMTLIFLLLTHLQITGLEEPLLRQRYGQAYIDYCARVPRWLPRLWPARG